MKNNCAALQDDLVAYRDGELPWLRRVIVRCHLLRCPACRQEIAIMDSIGIDLRAADNTALDPTLRSRIIAGVAATPAVPPKKMARANLALAWGTTLGCTAIMAATLIPTFARLRENARRATCDSNLTQLAVGTQQYAKDYDESFARRVTGEKTSKMDKRLVKREDGIVDRFGAARAPYKERNLDGSNFAFSDGHVKWLKPTTPSAVDNAASSSTVFTFGTGDEIGKAPQDLPATTRQVHREASISVEVDRIEQQSEAVENLVKAKGGYISDNNLQTQADGRKVATLEIRVPVGDFETVMRQVGQLGNVVAKKLSGEDITEKVSDAGAADRVMQHELTVQEARLKRALDRAGRRHYEDTWQVRQETRELRVQAAQAQARLELLHKLASLSNISVELREKTALPPQTGMLEDMRSTGSIAWETFAVALRYPLIAIIWILAYSPLWLPVLLVWRYVKRQG